LAPPKAPFDVVAMMRREMPPGPKVKLQAGSYSGEVEATATPVVEVKPDETKISFSFGSEGIVHCTIYPDPIDPASDIASTLRADGDKMSIREVKPYAVVAVGEDPALFVEASYVVSRPGGIAVGQLKLAAIDSPTAPMLCLHDELGYADTFKRVTTELAASIQSAHPRPVLKYVALWVARIGDAPVGFGREVAGVDDERRPVFESCAAFLLPKPALATELVIRDIVESDTEDGHGGVLEIRFASGDATEGGAKSVVAKRVGTQEYTYEGTGEGGKKVSGKFKTKGPRGLRSAAERAAIRRDLVSGKPVSGQTYVERYSPDKTVTEPVESLYRLLGKPERKVEESTDGEITWTGTIDEKGLLANGELSGKPPLTLERILVRGTP
jgi:hypothetical protein